MTTSPRDDASAEDPADARGEPIRAAPQYRQRADGNGGYDAQQPQQRIDYRIAVIVAITAAVGGMLLSITGNLITDFARGGIKGTSDISVLQQQLSGMQQQIAQRFVAVERQLEQLNDKTDRSFTQADAQRLLQLVEARLETDRNRLSSIERRLDVIEVRQAQPHSGRAR